MITSSWMASPKSAAPHPPLVTGTRKAVALGALVMAVVLAAAGCASNDTAATTSEGNQSQAVSNRQAEGLDGSESNPGSLEVHPDGPGSTTGVGINPLGEETPTPVIATDASAVTGPGPEEVANSFLAAWGKQDTTAAGLLTTDPQAATAAMDATLASMEATLALSPGVFTAPSDSQETPQATQRYSATYHLTDLGDWTFASQAAVVPTDQGWKVQWSPTVIHPKLTDNTVLTRGPGSAVAASVLDRNDKPLMQPTAVVNISIRPDQLVDSEKAYAILQQLGRDVEKAKQQVEAGPPTKVFPQITVRKTQFDPHEANAKAAGLITTPGTRTLAPNASFGRAVLAAALGANQVTKSGGGGAVLLAAKTETSAAGVADAVTGTTTLYEFPTTTTNTVSTTLDLNTQTAAEKALDTVNKKAAALVAIDTTNGDVLAAANRDSQGASTAFNRAFLGQYPPGSTFKILSASTFLHDGLAVTDPVGCPKNYVVSGRSFKNFEDSQLGTVPFLTNFAQSCNTAFVGQAHERLKNETLHDHAPAFGLATDWNMGVPAYSGSVPVATGPVDLVASALGQGRVLASPLGMASVAATVASGTWNAPTLIRSVTKENGGSLSGSTSPTATPLATAPQLKELMFEAVSKGTGQSSLGSLVGKRKAGQIGSKTGTAEFNVGGENRTHAWIVGFVDNVAFSVIIEDGGVGGRDAGPVARTFLTALGKK